MFNGLSRPSKEIEMSSNGLFQVDPFSVEIGYACQLTQRIKGNKMMKNMPTKINDSLYNLGF